MTLDWPTLLPLIFAGLMGLAILIYVILDGFDLGIGILFAVADDHEKDVMVSAIGPFWDANETWLVLAVGLLLIAFPHAHGIILTALYIPVALLLVGLILRGVAFDFRAKVPVSHKHRWNRLFLAGSLIASLAEGYMLGVYVLGLDVGFGHRIRRAGGALPRRSLFGDGRGLADLQDRRRAAEEGGALAARRARPDRPWHGRDFARYAVRQPAHLRQMVRFPGAALFVAAADPVGGAVRLAVVADLPSAEAGDRHALPPFLMLALIFALGFAGLAWSFYPFVVPDRLTIWQAASAPESLAVILVGTAFVLPIIICASVYVYRVFGGKATELTYD